LIFLGQPETKNSDAETGADLFRDGRNGANPKFRKRRAA
jgi:hypothetical protein